MASISASVEHGRTSDLIKQTNDWGVSVSESVARRTPLMRALAILGYTAFALASLFVIPILVGTTLFTASRGVLADIGIVGGIVALAMVFNAQSRKGPKNALQIDYDACEVRLGSMTSAGAFVRHKVCPLRSIDSVSVDTSAPEAPALTFNMFSETATIRFAKTDAGSLATLAARIQSAADEARAAPMRSRIVSRINGFEAGVREIGQRVRSRVTSSFA